MQEGVIEICALKGGHTAIFTRLSIEDKVDSQQGTAEDTCAVQQTLAHIALRYGVVCCLLIPSAEGLAEEGDILRGREGGLGGAEELGLLPEWRAVEGADCERLCRFGRYSLSQCRSDGEGSPQEEGHVDCVERSRCRCEGWRELERLADIKSWA